MTLSTPSAPAPATQAPEIRFYQIAAGKRTWYAITTGRLVAAATHDYHRACQYYAWERGVPRSQIGGPTHRVADAKALAASLANPQQEGHR